MEKPFRIKTKDGKYIEGIVRGSLKRPVIVLVHGLTGSTDEALHYNAARYFGENGFSSCRFNLYGWEKDCRKLHQCTLKTHGADINRVVEFLRLKGAKKIFAVGHSYGFPSILSSQNQYLKAITSWDGSVLPRKKFKKLKHINSPVEGVVLNWGVFSIMGRAMADEEQVFNSIKLIQSMNLPLHLVTAGQQLNFQGAQKIRKALKTPKLTVIRGAAHCFTEDGKQAELYKATVDWFKRFI